MNINAISNQSFQAKVPNLPEARVKVVGKVNGYVEQMLNEGNAVLEGAAKLYNTTVRVAQKGDHILVNAGPKTSFFDYKAMAKSDEFYQNIINNIKENSMLTKIV